MHNEIICAILSQMNGIIAYQISEIVLGVFVIWVGLYIISRNPNSKISWIVFALLLGFGFSTLTDPILLNTRNLHEYVLWQNITDWPLFFSSAFYYHASLLALGKDSPKKNWILAAGYLVAILLYVIDIYGGFILIETIFRIPDYRRFAPGLSLIPTILFVCLYYFMGAKNFFSKVSLDLKKFILPAIGGLIYVITGFFCILSYYTQLPFAGVIFMFGTVSATLFFICSMIKYHLFSPAEKNIFDQTFYYKTTIILITIISYLSVVCFSGIKLDFNALVLSELLTILIMFSHSFYDLLSTFVNDLVYNPSRGFSVVNDEEVNNVIKYFNKHERLESSPLMRLKIINNQIAENKKLTPVDALRSLIRDSIEYFKPIDDSNRRIKSNLKYHFLSMIAFDEAEEGQILWELGFDDYPVKIMSQERKCRPPLFKITSPSDYVFTSRNAYLALKKEAIHDLTWRISYLEKQAKR